MNLAYRIAYIVLRPITALLYPQSQTGRENIPDGPCVVCANHSNYIDAVLVAFALGWKNFVHFLAKKELFHIPFFGWFLRRVQAVSIDRGKNNLDGVRASMKYLKRGEKLLIFPEGTRVSEDDAVAAKSGAVRMAAKLGVPILPVFVPRNKKIFRKVHIRIGKPYKVEPPKNGDYTALSSELMAEIRRLGGGWRMKKLIVAGSAGFCFGVERSVRLAEDALREGPCFCLGQLVHNDAAVAALEAKGLRVIDSPEELPEGGRVVIRSHGAGRAAYERMRARRAVIVDATCPRVARIHRLVSEAEAKGRLPIVVGDASHPEVQAICGWCSGALVAHDRDALELVFSREPQLRGRPLTVVFQTTQTEAARTAVMDFIKKECTNAETFDTICDATSRRQSEARRLAQVCDAMVVIGGRHSANSMHLAEICREHCKNVQFVENAGQLDLKALEEAETVGVTAGASAPAWIIEEVEQKMGDEMRLQETAPEQVAEPLAEETPAVGDVIGELHEPAAEAADTKTAEAADTIIKEEKAEEAPREEEKTEEASAEEEKAEEVPAEEEKTEEASAEEEKAEEVPAEEEKAEEVPAEEEKAEEAPVKPDGEKTFHEMLEDSIKTIYPGDTVSGTVAAITATDVSVDLGTKHSGYIPLSEFAEDGVKAEDVIHVGDRIEACVIRVNDMEGTIMLSKKRLDAVRNWADIEAARDSGAVVEGKVTEDNKGGVVVNIRGIRVFVPASQTGLGRDVPMSELVGQTVRLKVTEVNRSRRRVVGSIRAVINKERRERAEKIWNEIEVGKRYHGVVKSMTSYGAFVDIGGIDGMVHVSELSWERISKPADALTIGQEIDVYVIGFDRESKRISLGHKDPAENPWKKFMDTYQVGSIVKAKIVKLMPFGAFAEVMPGVDGLIHISQIANRRIGKPDEVLKVGEIEEVKITNIDNEKQKISLSIRALSEPAPAPRREEAVPEEDALVYTVSTTGEAVGSIPPET